MVSDIPAIAAFAAEVRDLTDLSLEGRDGRSHDDHATFLVLWFVLGHVGGGQARHVEGSDEVQVDHSPELGEGMWPLLGQGPSGDTAASRVDRDVQAAQGLDRIIDRGLGALGVEDVHRVERTTELLGHLRTVGRLEVEDGDARSSRLQLTGGRSGHA